VWTSQQPAAAPAQVLAFDAEAGSLAFVDSKGRPARLDLRMGTAAPSAKAGLVSLTSADGYAIFGLARDTVVRLTPSGAWRFRPSAASRELLPGPDGSVIVVGARAGETRLVRMRPPDTTALNTVVLPASRRAVRTPVGDRIYFVVDSGLVGVRARDLAPVPSVRLDGRVRAIATSPSGDRVFVLTDGSPVLRAFERYAERVTEMAVLPGEATDLRIDPLGRYLLARAASGDSVWVIAVGTGKLLGSVSTPWLADLPFVGPDGSIVLAQGADVVLVDGETLKPRARVRGGAADFWHLVQWDGFRPRAAGLDEPVVFAEPVPDSGRFDSMDSVFAGARLDPEIAPAPAADSAPRTVPRPAPQVVRPAPPVVASTPAPAALPNVYTVQFHAVLAEARARELAFAISVDGQLARVVRSGSADSPIYKVVLGPYASRPAAEKAGRASGASYWIYQGAP